VADSLCEVINDADAYLVNVWRSLQADPEGTMEWADNPVNEAALHSVHRWLVLGEGAEKFRQRMRTDPDYYDSCRAGRWLFGCCCWIGGGWCSAAHGPEGGSGERRPMIAEPCVGGQGLGVHRNADVPEGRPQLADAYDIGRGVHASPPQKRPPLAGSSHSVTHLGMGVHASPPEKRPSLGGNGWAGTGSGLGINASSEAGAMGSDEASRVTDFSGGTCAQRRAWLLDWFGRLRDRLRNVRVCCGDWSRVCSSESVLVRLGITGVFLDPPYPRHRDDGAESRSGGLYSTDAASHKSPEQLRDEILAWARLWGPQMLMRIIIAGYEGDGYEALVAVGWTVEAWKAQGGYGNRSAKGKENRHRERLWLSPHCRAERGLFDQKADD
jgi:hypothetical protein